MTSFRSSIPVAAVYDPATEQPRIARGVIAIGNIAIGGFALGGLAISLNYAIGGLAIAPHAISSMGADPEALRWLKGSWSGICQALPELFE